LHFKSDSLALLLLLLFWLANHADESERETLAIEDADDRQTHAAEIIRHVFADTEVAEEAARQSMLAWEEIPWEKLRTPAEYDYPVSVEQRRRRAGRR
jgi:hypothetical protein